MWFIAKKVELYLVTLQSSPQGKEKNMNVNSQFVTNNPMTLCQNDEIDKWPNTTAQTAIQRFWLKRRLLSYQTHKNILPHLLEIFFELIVRDWPCRMWELVWHLHAYMFLEAACCFWFIITLITCYMDW